jgi:hypothetical protein
MGWSRIWSVRCICSFLEFQPECHSVFVYAWRWHVACSHETTVLHSPQTMDDPASAMVCNSPSCWGIIRFPASTNQPRCKPFLSFILTFLSMWYRLILGFGVISSLSVEEGFRQVDRKFFVPKVRLEGCETLLTCDHVLTVHVYLVLGSHENGTRWSTYQGR